MKRTVFTKKNKRSSIEIPGTHPSLHNGLLLVSTGVPTFDSILGGGLPVGSVCLVEEDEHNRFAKILLKYFMAEGCICQHGLYLACSHEHPQHILDHLPQPVDHTPSKDKGKQNKDDMKIAFMYKDLPKNMPTLSNNSKFDHYYNLSLAMESTYIEKCKIETLDLNAEWLRQDSNPDLFRFTLGKLQMHVKSYPEYQVPSHITPDTKINVLRVAIPNIGLPLWCENKEENIKDIARFLHCLRALVRNSMTVCMITIPRHLYSSSQVAIFREMVDCAVQLQAFIGDVNPAFKQYHGLFHIHKLPCLNSLTSFVPESFDLAFELKKTKFVIECFHLPPDISETASRQGLSESNPLKTISPCSGDTLPQKLDF